MRKNEWKREPTKQARPPESRTIGARDAKMSTLAKIIRKSQAMNRSSARKRTEHREHMYMYMRLNFPGSNGFQPKQTQRASTAESWQY